MKSQRIAVVGEYPLSAGAQVIVVTSSALRPAAARTPDGAFGAVVRVSVTRVGANTQVAYTNPAWMSNVYRLAGAGADSTVMRITDTGARRHTAHLPYEVLVSGWRVTMLHGKFRIAQSYPDLTCSVAAGTLSSLHAITAYGNEHPFP